MGDSDRPPNLDHRLTALRGWEPPPGQAAAEPLDQAAARRRRRRHGVIAVAATVSILGGLAWFDRERDSAVVTAESVDDPAKGFDAWGPGWHEIDTGPVPAMGHVSIEWIGDELLVVGDGRAFTFSPVSRAWTDRGRVPLFVDGLEAVAGTVVAVGSAPDGAEPFGSVLDLTTWTWSRPTPIPAHPTLERVGFANLSSNLGPESLARSGSHVFDVGRMAVFDPRTSMWSSMALPANVIDSTHLLYGDVATIDGAVELVSPSREPGLRWNSDGSAFTETAGMPDSMVTGGSIGATSSARLRRGVVVADIDAGPEGPWRTWVYDGSYRPIPSTPGPPSRGCPELAATGARIVSLPCSASDAYLLEGDRWVSIGAPPVEPSCCSATADTGDALVVWSTSTDTANDPANAPYVDAAVWVPGRSPTADEPVVTAPATTTVSCATIDDLSTLLSDAYGGTSWSSTGPLDPNGCPSGPATWTSPESAIRVTAAVGSPPGLVLWQDAVSDVRIGLSAPDGGTAQRFVGSVGATPWFATVEPDDELDALFKALIATRDRTRPINITPDPSQPRASGGIETISIEAANRGGTITLAGTDVSGRRTISASYGPEPETADCPASKNEAGNYLNITVGTDDPTITTDPSSFEAEPLDGVGGLVLSAAVTCRSGGATFVSLELADRVPLETSDRWREGTITVSLG